MICRILFLVFSVLLISGCIKGGPSIEICIIDAKALGAHCVQPKKKGQKEGDLVFKNFDQVNNYVCTSPEGFGKLLDYAKKK